MFYVHQLECYPSKFEGVMALGVKLFYVLCASIEITLTQR
jgi:hypothetical protein